MNDNQAERLSRISPNLKWRVSYTLKGKKGGKMGCGGEDVTDSKSVETSANNEVITVGDGLSLEAGKKYRLENVRIERLNSKFFSGSSSEKSTNAEKF